MVNTKKVYNFFKEYQDLIGEPKNTRENSMHGDIYKILKKSGKLHWTWGKCFHVSLFLFYSYGGYDGPYELRLTKNIVIKVNGHEVTTTHWFIQHKETGEIVDLTTEQFDGLVDMETIYEKSTKGAFGVPWVIVNGEQVRFKNNAPTSIVLELYGKWLKTNDPIEGLHKFYTVGKSHESLF